MCRRKARVLEVGSRVGGRLASGRRVGEGGFVRGGRLVRGLLGSEVGVLPSSQILDRAVKAGSSSYH